MVERRLSRLAAFKHYPMLSRSVISQVTRHCETKLSGRYLEVLISYSSGSQENYRGNFKIYFLIVRLVVFASNAIPSTHHLKLCRTSSFLTQTLLLSSSVKKNLSNDKTTTKERSKKKLCRQ